DTRRQRRGPGGLAARFHPGLLVHTRAGEMEVVGLAAVVDRDHRRARWCGLGLERDRLPRPDASREGIRRDRAGEEVATHLRGVCIADVRVDACADPHPPRAFPCLPYLPLLIYSPAPH